MTGLLDSLGLAELVIILVVVAVVVGGFVLGGKTSGGSPGPPAAALPPSSAPLPPPIAAAEQPDGPPCRSCGTPLRTLADGRPAEVCEACGRVQSEGCE